MPMPSAWAITSTRLSISSASHVGPLLPAPPRSAITPTTPTPPPALPACFRLYNAPDHRSRDKEEKSVFTLKRHLVALRLACSCTDQFALFAGNFIRWAGCVGPDPSCARPITFKGRWVNLIPCAHLFADTRSLGLQRLGNMSARLQGPFLTRSVSFRTGGLFKWPLPLFKFSPPHETSTFQLRNR